MHGSAAIMSALHFTLLGTRSALEEARSPTDSNVFADKFRASMHARCAGPSVMSVLWTWSAAFATGLSALLLTLWLLVWLVVLGTRLLAVVAAAKLDGACMVARTHSAHRRSSTC